MSAARKDLPPPGGGDELAAQLQQRLRRSEGATPRTDAISASSATSRTRERSAAPAMDRRSWYLPRATADALAAAIDELHWTTRRPKHEIAAALLAVALEHKDEAQKRLTD